MERVRSWCGVAAPASFVGAWAVCGALRNDGYDPVQDAISQLARVGSPTRAGMTAGFVAFGVLLPVFAGRLPDLLDAPRLRWSMWTAGLSTLAVGALPLQREAGGTGDLLHAVAAGTGYLAMAASPALVAGRTRFGMVSAAVSAVSAASLVVSVTSGPTGLWQRVGLGVVDAWFAGCALWSLRVSDGTVRR
ncbi:MAG: hypothetical protein JWN77_1175 [Frankiales bacterium]|nr:hypothetical protein [Frankiales bacterium]